ncbi:MAG: saccharopine dehydrogenase NADP-binding domain-containing protein [Anaerolineales bacterium]|nr:saccharopine dehydrogenase NADP-binding domain-containing protein [Anaerolineales bacterium]
MKVLLVGVGGVGEAIAAIAKPRKWMELMVLADYNVKRAEEVQKKMGDTRRFPVEFIDASNQQSIEDLAKKYQVDLIMNSVDPIFNKQIFDAAYNVGAKYMDMAMTLSEPHPTDPFNKPGIKLGDYQFEKAKDWEKKGLLALVGFGVEPGMADVFARYAQDHLFDEIEEVGIRDGANITIDPRWVKTKRATFKYGLGDQFIDVLKTLHMLGLDNKNKINVKGVQVAPRDVVAACLPDPAHLGEKMHGKTCAGTWVKGIKDGKPRQVYLYQVADNQQCMQAWGCQAVVAQTAFSAVIAMDLVEHGQWTGAGVLGPEAFEPTVFMEKMADYGFPYGIKEMTA